MTKQKQIEEMANNLEEKFALCGTLSSCGKTRCAHCYSKYLYEQGYRKIDKDNVVISREEYEEYKQFQTFLDEYEFENVQDMEDTLNICQKLLYERLKQAGKKTAKKFYDKINENLGVFKLENKSEEYKDGYIEAIADVCGRIDQVAKQFDIEINE